MSIELVGVPNEIDLAGNPVFFTVKGTQYAQDNYNISAQLYVETVYNSGTFETIPEMVLNVDSSGHAWINFSRIFKRRVKPDLPTFGESGFTKCTQMIKRFKVIFKERYGDPVTDQSTKETAVYQVISGKVNQSAYPTFNLINYMFEGKNYLSRQTEERETWLDAPQYLFFLMPVVGANLDVFVKAFYMDGTTSQKTAYQIPGAQKNEIFRLPTSPKDLDIIDSNKELWTYEVWINYTSGTYIDQTAGRKITYKIVSKPRTGRAFLFLNRLGSYSTVLTYRQDNKLNVKRDENLQSTAPDYSPLSGDINSDVKEFTDEFEVITGPLPIREAELLKEMLLTKEFYLVGRTAFVKCNLKGGTFPIVPESKDLHSIKFKYAPAFQGDLLCSKLGLPVQSNGDYSGEYGNDYNV